MNDKEERIVLSKEQAKDMLADGDRIHTFRSVPRTLIGADWTRKEIEAHIDKNRCELAGPMAVKMNHGLAILDMGGPLFVATRPK